MNKTKIEWCDSTKKPRGRKKRNLTEYGKRIKIELINKNMAQNELARLIGAPSAYLSFIMHGRRSGEKYAAGIEQVLGVRHEGGGCR